MVKKLSKKQLRIIIISAIMSAVIGLSVFLGIFIYRRTNPDKRFAIAEEKWQSDKEKKAEDNAQINITLGKEPYQEKIALNISGERIYKKDALTFDYEVEVVYAKYDLNVLVLNFNAVSNNEGNKVIISKTSGFVDFATIEKSFSNEEAEQYIDLKALNKSSLHDVSEITIDKENNYYIEGKAAYNYLISQVLDALVNVTDIDIGEIIANNSTFGKVRGRVLYDDKLYFKENSNSQDISLFMTWQQADEIVNKIDNLPEKFSEIYSQKKLVIENLPIIGSYTIDFNDIFADGISVNININMKSVFTKDI